MRPYYSLSGHWGLTQLSTGQPFYVDKRARDLTAWIVMGGVWETFVDDVLCALARPGDTFIDAGANQGYYTVKIGGLVGPTGRVFAFEANPEMAAFVAENINVNGQSGRDVVRNVAIGDAPGELRFCHNPSHPGGGTLLLPGDAEPPGLTIQTVPVARIDDLLPAETRIDLMKIDVEGFEVPVFKGMVETLRRSPNAAIVCEVAGGLWGRFGDPSALLRECAGGRRLFRIFHDGRLEEMDGDRLETWLDPTFVSYVLMLPDTPERMAQLKPLLDRFAPPASPSEGARPAAAAPPPTPVPAATPQPQPVGLLRRIARRLFG